MENKNNHLKDWEERSACYKQILPLSEQSFEQQREALLDIEGQVRAIVGDNPMLVSYQDIRPHCRELRLLLHQDKKLVPACEVFDVLVAMVFAHIVVEQTPVQKRGELGENVFVFVHLPRVFGKDKFKSVSLQNLRD